MIKDFKFFHGIVNVKMRLVWPEDMEDHNTRQAIDAENELTRLLSEEIARSVDDEVLRMLTRRINGGYNQIA
jgi:hypothetical protein